MEGSSGNTKQVKAVGFTLRVDVPEASCQQLRALGEYIAEEMTAETFCELIRRLALTPEIDIYGR